jgi:hypothetical protein
VVFNCSGSHKGTKTQRVNIRLSPYLKSLPAIASRSGEAGGEAGNVRLMKRVLKEYFSNLSGFVS